MSIRVQGYDQNYIIFWSGISILLAVCGHPLIALLTLFPLIHNSLAQYAVLGAIVFLSLQWSSCHLLVGEEVSCTHRACSLTQSSPSIYRFFFRLLPLAGPKCQDDTVYKVQSISLEWKDRCGLTLPSLVIDDMVPTRSISKSSPGFSIYASSLSTQLFDVFCFGNGKFNPWSDLLGLYGLRHLLCFSGWHAHKIWQLCRSNRYIFGMIGGIYLCALGIPFSFLCAYIKGLIPAKNNSRASYWARALIISSVLCPFAWTSLSYWLTCYYIILIETHGLCELRLRCSGLGWCALMGSKIGLLSWSLGLFIERIFLYIIATIWTGYGIHFIAPSYINTISEAIFMTLSYLQRIDIIFQSHWSIGALFLALPFIIPSQKFPLHEKKSCAI